MLNALRQVDASLFYLINRRLGTPWLDPLFTGLSSLGEWTMAIIAVVMVAETGRRCFWRHVAALAGVLLLVVPLHSGLKRSVSRPRPKAVFEHASDPAAAVRMPLGDAFTPRHNSFPSGHSAFAFLLMSYVARTRPRYRVAAWTLASGVAVARVYVGAHFPSDCVAGALLGTGAGVLASSLFRRIQPKAAAEKACPSE